MTFALALLGDKAFESAPELIGGGVLIALTLGGLWRLLGKLQDGQNEVIDKFLGHIEESEKRQKEEAAAHRSTLERVQKSLDENTRMLGKTGAALERASEIIDRLENQLDKKQETHAND